MTNLLCISLVFICSLGLRADPPGVHGMLIFGKSKIYASHLPMFHMPHDYQAVMELNLPSKAADIYFKDAKIHGARWIYTLVPEPFVLPEMLKSPRAFSARLYRGHFERGGVEILKIDQVNISRVVLNRKLSEKSAAFRYSAYLFGSSQEPYALHFIQGKPSFDQILRLKPQASMNFVEGVLVNSTYLEQPVFEGRLNLNHEVERSIYVEKDDLM
ncbi:MAG: hypothetical protein V4534_07850 [Myxococcota bacterium]